MEEQQEFYMAVVIYGGVIFAGLLVTIVLGAVALKLWGNHKEQKIVKKLYEQKRKNGRGGSSGTY